MVLEKWSEKLIGIFFILSFISYGLGSVLIESVMVAINDHREVFLNKNLIVTGVILMAVFHTLFNVGLISIFYSVFRKYSKHLALGYFSLAMAGTLMLALGAVFYLMLIPLNEVVIGCKSSESVIFQSLSEVLISGNYYAYQIGMAFWGAGGLILCYMMQKLSLVPRFLAVWGLIGYLIFISGTVLELYGFKVGVMLSIPGGLFEIFLSFWLIVKGFRLTSE